MRYARNSPVVPPEKRKDNFKLGPKMEKFKSITMLAYAGKRFFIDFLGVLRQIFISIQG